MTWTTTPTGSSVSSSRGYVNVYFHVIQNRSSAPVSAVIGNPLTSSDDVVVDGLIITAEHFDAAGLFTRTIARAIAGRQP